MTYQLLIVDDSRTVRTVFRRTVEIAGYGGCELHEAANGREALELLATTPIDLVFTDIHMPEVGGVELIREIRRQKREPAVPVVVISSDRSARRRAELEELGVVAVVPKPFRAESIRDLLTDTLGATTHG